MLTQFGKTWVDVSRVFSVTETHDTLDGKIIASTLLVRSLTGANETLVSNIDPEGFKTFKAWLKYQSAKEVFKRQDARDEFVRTKMSEMGF